MRNWVGLLNGYQNADIRAQVTGYLMTQDYKEGSLVKKGEVLFTIDKRPFEAALAQAQADYAKAVANAQLAEITLDRQTQLYRTKVISQQEYDTSYQNTQASIASVAAQQANVQTAKINLNYCTITAPLDGIAGVAQAQIGDLVGPGGTASVLTQMSQVNPIKVNFSITEEEYLGAAALLKRLQQAKQQDLHERSTTDSCRRHGLSEKRPFRLCKSAGERCDRDHPNNGFVSQRRRRPAAGPLRAGNGSRRGTERGVGCSSGSNGGTAGQLPGGGARTGQRGASDTRQTRSHEGRDAGDSGARQGR